MVVQAKAIREIEREADAILTILASSIHDIPSIEQAVERIKAKCRNTEAQTIHTKGGAHAPQ